MRVHIYQQEMTGEIKLLRKSAEGHDYLGVGFVSALYVASPRRPVTGSSGKNITANGVALNT